MKKLTNENVVVILAVISALSVMIGLFLPTLGIWLNKPELNHVAVYFWAFFIVPFMSLQFFLPAGIYVSLVSDSSLFVKSLIYFAMIPAANVWFFFWTGTIFNFLPPHDSLDDVLKLLLMYSTVLSISLTVVGLFVRYLKFRREAYHKK